MLPPWQEWETKSVTFFLVFYLYFFGSKTIYLKKNLDYEHTSLLQLKNPKPNKKTNIKSSITGHCLKDT